MKLNLIKEEKFKSIQSVGLSGIMIALLDIIRLDRMFYEKCVFIVLEYNQSIPEIELHVPHTIIYGTGFFTKLN